VSIFNGFYYPYIQQRGRDGREELIVERVVVIVYRVGKEVRK